MTAFVTTTLLLFPGLGLVALAVGLLVRRYSLSALIVGLTGLLALAAASAWITAGPMSQLDKLVSDNAGLKETIARLKAELDDARRPATESTTKTEPTEPQGPIAALESELLAERSKRAETQDKAADAGRMAAAATARIADLDRKLREAQDARLNGERRAELGAQPPPAPAPPDLPGIRRKLDGGDRSYYSINVERELIPDNRGIWYVVRLLQNGKDWSFADRQFVLTDATEIKEINESAARLREDVLLPLSQAGQKWRLYVRGAADSRHVVGPVGRELTFLPRSANGTHSPKPIGKRVPMPVQNEGLPTLRADWLREIVRPVLGAIGKDEIEILENPPQPGHGRTAEFVLFVEW